MDPHALIRHVAQALEACNAVEEMPRLIGFSAGTGEADMEAMLITDIALALREHGIHTRVRRHEVLVAEETGTKICGDALYTFMVGDVEADVLGRTDPTQMLDAWFSHYYEGHGFGGAGEVCELVMPMTPSPTRMLALISPGIARAVALAQAEALEDQVAPAGGQRPARRM